MKLRLLLVVLAVACLGLLATGCGAKVASGGSPTKGAEADKSDSIVLTEKDTGHSIEMSAGQKFSVKLASNRTTGFGWTVAESATLKQSGEPSYDAPNTSGVVGAGGTETFAFTAGESGSSTLKLEYRRPWEKGVPAEQTWEVTVVVK